MGVDKADMKFSLNYIYSIDVRFRSFYVQIFTT